MNRRSFYVLLCALVCAFPLQDKCSIYECYTYCTFLLSILWVKWRGGNIAFSETLNKRQPSNYKPLNVILRRENQYCVVSVLFRSSSRVGTQLSCFASHCHFNTPDLISIRTIQVCVTSLAHSEHARARFLLPSGWVSCDNDDTCSLENVNPLESDSI